MNHPLILGTPVEDHIASCNLLVKREDLACPPPGPPFSKTRGVFAHIARRPESLIGVLDTRHSQGGHAVAHACSVLGKQATVYYPEFKHEPGARAPQLRAQELGARLVGIAAGRSAILYHQAKRQTTEAGGHMMPNALKLDDSVSETADEFVRTAAMASADQILVSVSSGTIAAGVLRGMRDSGWKGLLTLHLGYSRSQSEVERYVSMKSLGVGSFRDVERLTGVSIEIVDEGYSYSDEARAGETPPWPCNSYYDLKAFRWHMRRDVGHQSLLWNIG